MWPTYLTSAEAAAGAVAEPPLQAEHTARPTAIAANFKRGDVSIAVLPCASK
jgi:hypothetical protein